MSERKQAWPGQGAGAAYYEHGRARNEAPVKSDSRTRRGNGQVTVCRHESAGTQARTRQARAWPVVRSHVWPELGSQV